MIMFTYMYIIHRYDGHERSAYLAQKRLFDVYTFYMNLQT